MGTDEQYKTLACEITLRAYNDYIRYMIDLYTLENPEENDFTRNRFGEIVQEIVDGINRYRKKTGEEIRNADLHRRVHNDLKLREKFLRKKIEICEDFFCKPHPVAGLLGVDGEWALAKADEKVEKWLATGTVHYIHTIRPLSLYGGSKHE